MLVDTTSSVLYTVEVRDSNTCVSRDSFALTINPLPVVRVKATDTLRCDNPQVLLEPLTASGSLQFQWKTSAGHTLADSSQVWVDSMDTYIVEVMDSVGCSSSDSTRVITYIPQIVQIDSFPSTHCDSANAQIRIQMSSPGAWLYRIDSTEWDTSATFSGLLMGTYAISIAAPDTSCIIDTTITIGSREICIEICAGDSILIGRPSLNPWCMKWLPEDGLSNPDSSYTWVKPMNSTIYRLIITDDDGNILDSLIYNVTLCPQLSVSPSTLNLCEQNNPTLSAVGGTGPYIWRNQNGAIVGEGQTYAPTEPGMYTVQQSNNLALAASANVNKQLGNQKLQIEPGLAAICGDSVRLSVAGNFHNFVWRDGNGQTLSQKSYAFIKQQGTYTLTAEVGEGCVLDTQTTVFASGFALSIPAEDIVISCNKTRSLPYPIVETRYGSGIDSLLVTAPEHYQFRAEWRKDCQSCGQVRLSIESDESIGGNTPCTKVIRRTWVARDECGRRATATQIIRWQDNTAPAFVQFPESDTLMWGWPLPTETPIVSDDCDATPKLSRTVDSTSTSTIKVVQIHWQARDTCGNTHTQTQIITYLKPAVEDSFNLSAKYACGDDFTAQTPSNQEPLGVLRPKTVIDAYGFSVQVTKVDGPEINATGVYSGEAVAMIPFINKPARFRFSSLKINSSYEVLSGNLTSITDSDFKLPTFGTAQSKLDICLPPPPPPVGTNGENDSGFDADGKYVKQPPYEGHQPGDVFDPTRDPNGFDKDGIHVETGTIYNPQGCSAQGVDSTGQKCDPTGAGPYYWLNPNGLDGPPTGGGTQLANQVRDTLRPLVIQVLKELQRVNDSLILELKADCDELRGGTDAAYAATGMGDRDLVFGTDDQFFKEGLAKSFESRPKLLPETVQREAAHFDLQKKHVKLFECDESMAKLRALSTLLLSLQQDPGLSSLVREMIERLKRVSDADTASINTIAELIPWLSGQVSTYATNLNNFKFNRTGSIEATPATPHIKHARDWGEQISTFNAPTPDASQQAAALLAEYESGAEYIGGVHRAFYLREIVRQRQSQWFATDSLKIGASLFPIEIKSESKGAEPSFLLENLRITSSGAYLDAYIILNIQGKEIVFRAQNVPLDPSGLKEDGKMYLANDVEMRLSNAVMMIFKANTTYVNWDCHGFDKAGLDLEFEFCEKIIVPVDPQTQQVIANARVKGRATAVIEDLNDFTVAINITPFALTNHPEVQISVQNAIADFSDTETPEEIKFPTGYTFPEGNYERWRGVYLGQVSVTLPISFAESGQNVAIGAENFIIDDQGVSGSAFAANFINLSQGNFGGFAASVDTIRVDFLANHFVGAGLAGNIHLPLFGKPEGAIGPEDCFRYRGRMEPKQGFKFAVLPREDMTMDLLKAKATILASSSIEMQYVGGRFKVRATLNGSIAIDTLGAFKTEKEKPVASGSPPQDTMPQKQTKLGLALPSITFEKLVLSNEAPYLSPGIWTMPASASARLGKFKLGIDAMKLVAREGNQAGLYVETRVELSDDHKVPAKGAFEIYGELKIENGRQRWVGKGLRIKRFTVDADIKGNTIKGEVFHFDGDSTSVFGSGFRGTLSVKFAKLGGAGIDALAQFGEVDGFKYFMVDVMATLPGAGIPLGPMYIKKLGGGLSNRMTRTDDVSFPTNWGSSSGSGGSAGELGTSLSGVQYYPSSERGLGLRLALMMTAEKEESFNATVSLEAIFNSKASGGGIHELALDGFIQFMTKPNPAQTPVKSNKNGLNNPADTIPNFAKVAGFISIKYNFDEDIFDANFRVFFNDANMRGSGDARFYFSPAKWFINIGEPSKRINLTMDVPGLPNNALVMTAYLDIGNGIPAMPPLPAHIRELTGLGATQGAESTRGSGNGFAFGADLSITTGELKFLILYANLNAGVGFDLQLQQYGGASCAGSGELGINGWYASGQLWAYVQAEVGLQLKKNGNKFPIASLSAGVALQGQLPNPFWAKGSLAGRYKILGGLVKGKFNFKFTIGEPCQLVDENGQPVPEPELSLISELRPQNSTIGVSQIARPQATFTLPMNKARVPMLDEEGNTVYYQTSLTKLELRDSLGQVIACGLTYSKDSLQITLAPYELLPANARFSLYTEATCSHNGQVLVTDRDSVSFRTGLVASGIPAENVAYSYPTVGMQSFYRYEKADRQGYIQLKLGQKELLGLGQPVFARFEGGGSTTETLVSYSNYDKRLSFDIPADALQPATGYTLSIVSGGKVLLSFPFRSSQYAYFKDKMAAFAAAATSSWDGLNINFKAPALEPFDDAETLGQNEETPLIAFEMVIDNYPWYLNNFKKVYSRGEFDNFKSFEPLSRDVNASGPKGELALGFATGTTLENRLHAVLRQDLDDFEDQAALAEAQRLKTCGNDTSSRGCTKDAALDAFIGRSIPLPAAGSIPVMATYRLPGSKSVNSSTSFTWSFGAKTNIQN
ncbi:hypothetical protein [Haliscomenobacter sp.]|uniref:hypothetical protein n=1 Tax=Haliscomenobacter sp. TaxID=2717303 RepID=UPI003593A959